jgi:sugar/nucleoside kinase (ribokinase family)
MRILIAGELNVDLVLQNFETFPALGKEVLVEDASLTLGSASAICAAGFVKLGDDVILVAKLGLDALGDFCMEALARLEIDCSWILRDESIKTGITVSITSRDDRALVTYLGSIAALRLNEIPEATFRTCTHLHVSSFFLQRALRSDLKSLFAKAHQNGLTTSLDPGFDPSQRWARDVIEVLDEVDVFLPNEIELAAITGIRDRDDALKALQNGRTLVVAKLGADGCIAMEDGDVVSVPGFLITPLDTTGAGDSFNAGFLHTWLSGKNLVESMRFASACGALSTQGLGGTASQPSEIEANQLIRSTEITLTQMGGHSR